MQAGEISAVTSRQRDDARLVWNYHQLRHVPRRCDAAIGLGSHDLGVPAHIAALFHSGMFATVVFSGAANPTRPELFPDGEAAQFCRHAVQLGVPREAILIEPRATNTGENIAFSRDLLTAAGRDISSVMLVAMPYMERRAFATCRRLWPDVEIVCASAPIRFEDYIATIGDETMVVHQLVGDLQRVLEYPELGFAIPQEVPPDVLAAYHRLLDDGFTRRLLTG